MDDFERNDIPETPAQSRPQPTGEFAASGPRADERVNGEYSFARPERSAYADAEYVSAANEVNMPRSYSYVPTEKKPRREKRRERAKKPRRGIPVGAAIAMCLVCAILGGALSFGAGWYFLREQQAANPAQPGTVINMVQPATPQVSTNVVASGAEMTPTDIYYSLAIHQVVGVTTEITRTNFWGYTSSSAVSGSGFIISENGYILTNYHVIEEAVKGNYQVTVLTYEGTKYDAAVIGFEEDNDVAVLKIEASGLNAATIGDSDGMRVGEMVYPVGNPLGELQYSMTDGMVSALDREIRSYDAATQTYTNINMFQISAAINSGNSGGPVYNSRGEVIGIATAKYSDTGVESLGFAIPIKDAIKIANDLMTAGYVRGKAYLGVDIGTVSASAAQYYGLVEGAIVTGVREGTCAERAGLQESDIVVEIDGKPIQTGDELIAAKKDYRAGDSAVLKIYRGGEYYDITVTFDEETPAALEAEAAQEQEQQPQQPGQYGQYGGDYEDFFNFFFGGNPFGR